MTPLRQRMIDDMTLAGLARTTQDLYIRAVRGLAGHYHRSPDQLGEEDVRHYLVERRAAGVARGTFKVLVYGIQFLYRQTLGRDWPLFSKKRSVSRGRSDCRKPCRTRRSAACWGAWAILGTGSALA